jgi:hypothetical protein
LSAVLCASAFEPSSFDLDQLSTNLLKFPLTDITMATEAASIYPGLKDRPVKNTVCLFDVDGTLTPARLVLHTLPAVLLSWGGGLHC